MPKLKGLRQRDITDCGATCLTAIATYYGIDATVAAIRIRAGTDRHGTTILGLLQAAEAIGLSAKGVKGRFEYFTDGLLPAVAHLRQRDGLDHFVVLESISGDTVRIMDPADGILHVRTKQSFLAEWTGMVVLFAPKSEVAGGSKEGRPVPSLVSRLVSLMRPHVFLLAQSVFGALIASVLALCTAIYVRNIIDHVIGDGNLQLLRVLTIGVIAVLTLRAVLMVLQGRLHHSLMMRIDSHLLTDYHRHLLSLPQQFFDSMRAGEVLSRYSDAVKIRAFLSDTALQVIVNTCLVLFPVGMMLFLSIHLAAILAGMLLVLVVLFVLGAKLGRTDQRATVEAAADFGAEVNETLHSVATIKRLALESVVGIRTEHRLVHMLRLNDRTARFGLFMTNVSGWVNQVGLVALLWLGTKLVMDTTISTGDMMSCYTLAAFTLGPIGILFGATASMHQAKVAADRLLEIMDLEAEHSAGLLKLDSLLQDGVRMRNVSFAHPGRKAVLKNVNLFFPAGRISLLVGDSGCGKSTVLALLQRIYLPNEGTMAIDGYNLELFGLRELRGNIAMMPQKVELFNESLIGNIVMGDPEPDYANVIGICKGLGLDAFIDQLPQKYATQIREGGANLSGGQKQKIALARAFYRRTPVILLDEPSSALDHESEGRLIQVLRVLRDRGVTIIMAAHNQRFTKIADVVVRFSDGNVVSPQVAVEECSRSQ